MGETWTLELDARPDRCRLSLVGVTYGSGTSLQDATNDFLVRVYDLTLVLRHGGFRFTSEIGRLDPRVAEFLWDVGELADRDRDIRQRVFGSPTPTACPPAVRGWTTER